MQGVTRDALTPDGQAGFWHARYTLRPALDPRTGAPAAAEPGSGGPGHEVPVFLQRVKEAVLSTGKYLNIMRESGAAPARMLPLGVHLGGWGRRGGSEYAGGRVEGLVMRGRQGIAANEFVIVFWLSCCSASITRQFLLGCTALRCFGVH